MNETNYVRFKRFLHIIWPSFRKTGNVWKKVWYVIADINKCLPSCCIPWPVSMRQELERQLAESEAQDGPGSWKKRVNWCKNCSTICLNAKKTSFERFWKELSLPFPHFQFASNDFPPVPGSRWIPNRADRSTPESSTWVIWLLSLGTVPTTAQGFDNDPQKRCEMETSSKKMMDSGVALPIEYVCKLQKFPMDANLVHAVKESIVEFWRFPVSTCFCQFSELLLHDIA